MKCKRCETLPSFKDKNVTLYVYIPTHHHEPLFEANLIDKNYTYEKHAKYYLVDVESLHAFIRIMRNLFNVLERSDIKILPFNKQKGLDPAVLHNMRTLEEWVDYYKSRQVRYVLRENALKVHFQPIMDKRTNEIFGYEGLVRGIDKDGSDIPPGLLFEQAKNLDLLFNLDKASRETVIRSAAEIGLKKHLFINFIPTAIYNPELCLKTTLEAIKFYDLAASKITFEVVESERIKDFDHLNTILEYYKARGFNTALDDVGSGYANMEAISRLRPSIIKIDQMIIRNIHKDQEKQKAFKAYYELAKKNDIRILAEGVETKDEETYLSNYDIDYAQGYYYGKPQPTLLDN